MQPDRRSLLRAAAALGIGTTTFHKAIAAQVSPPVEIAPMPQLVPTPWVVTAEMVKNAEWISGITLTETQRKRVASSLTTSLSGFQKLREVKLPNSVPPAFHFATIANKTAEITTSFNWQPPKATLPTAKEELAFLPVSQLSSLLQAKALSSVELTKLYLERLHTWDEVLKCVVSFTDDLAMKQARRADEEIAAGRYRGPLHGIPWGAKDILAVPGYKTTWGAGPYREQNLVKQEATVVTRLEEAGAVLIAKLTVGALAMGDRWFGGMTRNPWHPKEGSSGSSAGSASAVAAGLVGFAIGTETLGSIVSPSTRCGVTGLRPTFGRVSRHGCMALAWTLDKVGPMARSVEDCGLILQAIHGADSQDQSTIQHSFAWPNKSPLAEIRVGYIPAKEGRKERPEIDTIKKLGVKLVPMAMPIAEFRAKHPQVNTLLNIIDVESGAAFDELTRAGVTEGIGVWPNTFQHGQFISAIDYLRAQRMRTMLMRDFKEIMDQVDIMLPFSNDLQITNLTGHPQICLPDGFVQRDGTDVPKAITFTGQTFAEATLLNFAQAYQEATGHHRKHPKLSAKLLSDK